MNNSQHWMVYRGLRTYLGKSVGFQYRNSKREYWIAQRRVSQTLFCAICGKRVCWNTKTVDHIIPINIIFEYELPGLIFDHRNFQPAHKLCNTQRGALTINDMPDNIRNAMLKTSKRNCEETENLSEERSTHSLQY